MPKDLKILNFCLQCRKEIAPDRKFCSKKCKSLSQIKRIRLVCAGCGKEFLNLPYLKRKTNYCSMKCYWDSTRLKQKRVCKRCGKEFWADNSLIQKGFGLYCNRKCQFEDYPDRVHKICPQCGNEFEVPPSIDELRKFCSNKCRDSAVRDYVSRICRKCGKKFELPRSDLNRGRGNFCTFRCYLTYRGQSTLEEKMERALNLASIKFEREIKFKRFHVDFLIKDLKTVIECDGEYWHLMPIIQERDKRKDELLKNLGYKVLRFSGETISQLPGKKLANRLKTSLGTAFYGH